MNAVAALVALAIAAGAPATTIVSGPEGQVTATSARFEFTADDAAGFECSLDGAAFAACSSPFTADGLSLGSHKFSVRASNAAGEQETAPPRRSWSIVAQPNLVPAVQLRSPAKRRLVVKRFTNLAGTAVSAAGVTRVQVALTFGDPNRDFFPPRCWFINMSTGRLVRQTCLLPVYTTVSGTTTWRYSVPKRVVRSIPSGRYELIVRAFNGYNQATQRHFKLTLR